MPTDSYPLKWPEGWPRTPEGSRANGTNRFKRGDWQVGYKQPTIHQATQRLIGELGKLGAGRIVVSSNLKLRNDGLPISSQRMPDDPGIAVYFDLGGSQKTMARDAFAKPEHNATSLALAIEGMRQLARHGGGVMIDKAFAGFDALPAPGTASSAHWTSVLGLKRGASRENIMSAFKQLAMERHPDHGGSDVAMAELNAAREAALKEATAS